MIIVIGGDKGGTGKSHLATNLTVCLSQQGKRTGLVETDLNGSTKKWNKRREQAGLPPVALNEAYGDISAKITKMADVAEILIIDTAGYDSTEFRTALKVADIVIVPIDPLAQCGSRQSSDCDKNCQGCAKNKSQAGCTCAPV